MSGDLVAALRQLFYPDQIEWEAADAIEARDAEVDRLRAAGDALAAALRRHQMACGVNDASAAVAAWKEARRGR